MALRSSLGGVAFDHEVLPLNEAEPVQFLEESAVKLMLVGPHVAGLGYGGYQREAFRLCELLSHSRPHRRRNHQASNEVSPLHRSPRQC
jgi:hypothetical protein